MKSLPPRLCRRLITTQASPKPTSTHFYRIPQVTKANFTESLHHFNSHLSACDFVAVSLQTTGSYSAPWHKLSPFDTPHTAYLKAKYAAEKYHIFQFAVCPFTLSHTKLVAYPYNFHLFPRDELNIGMPSYSFYCETSNLMSMAREGFDLNACIDDGLSYLSRSQETAALIYLGSPILAIAGDDVKSTSAPSAADSYFIARIKSRVNSWLDSYKDSSEDSDVSMMKSLKKIILGNEEYCQRPSMRIDVSSERQAEMIVEMLHEIADEVVPLIIPAKGGEISAIRAVLTKSKEDKEILKRQIQDLDKEHKKKVCGFREVIDLICSSLKPVVCYNSLNDLTFIHSKFLAPLPPSMDAFTTSLESSFPLVIDVNHLMKEVGPERKGTSISVAASYLKNHFFAPTEVEIPCHVNDGEIHGQNALRICQLFAKLCYILKITPNNVQPQQKNLTTALEAYGNIFSPFSPCPEESVDGDVKIWSNNARKVGTEDLVFLWGFGSKMTARKLKSLLQESHDVFSKEFNVRFVDKGCAMVVFWQSGLARTFLEVMNNDSQIHGLLREMVSEGMTAAGYDTYARACRLELWEAHLSDALDKALLDHDCSLETNSDTKSSASELMINLDDL